MRQHRIITLLAFCCAIALAQIDAHAQSPFSGTYKGSYELGEVSAKVNLKLTLTPAGRMIKVRLEDQTMFEGDETAEKPTVWNANGTVTGNRLRFVIQTQGTGRRQGTPYTATMDGDALVLRFTLYYDPDGAYSPTPCRGCIKADQEVRMSRE